MIKMNDRYLRKGIYTVSYKQSVGKSILWPFRTLAVFEILYSL
jgi:hypothetical protein